MAQRIRLISSLACALLASGCADHVAPGTVAPEATQTALSESAWITTDRDGARIFQAHVGARASLELDPTSELVALQVPRAELATASQAIHDELHRCGGFMLERSFDAARAADIVSANESTTRALQVAYAIDNDATVTALMAPLAESNLRQTMQSLADFPTRFHESETGKQASIWIRDRWQSYVEGRADVTVKLIEHEQTAQPSIGLTIQGAKYPDELVILGGHMDSINRSGGAAPGADDNASGIAALDEVARAALELGYRPDRTVIFYGYAAEEVGLVGSAEIAEAALDQDLNVVGVLQFDMTNYNPSPNPYLAIVTDFTDATLNQFARQLIEKYVGLPWKDTACGYACSDHASWQRRGFPVHYVHEATTDESNEDIHTARDTLALSNGSAQHTLHFARYAAAFMAETAKGTIAECDANRPCPGDATCQTGTCVPSVGGAAGASGAAGAAGAGGSAGSSGSAGGSDIGGTAGIAGAASPVAGAPAAAGAPSQAGTAAGDAPTHLAPVTNEPLACSCRTPAQRKSSYTPASLLLILALTAARRVARRRAQRVGLGKSDAAKKAPH